MIEFKFIKNIVFLVCLLAMLNTNLKAQAPGFLGKKISLEYSPEVFREYSSYDKELILLHNLEVGYAMSRRTTVGLRGGFFRNNYTNFNVQNLEIGLSGKFFPFKSKGNIAPLGSYVNLEIIGAFPKTSAANESYNFVTQSASVGYGKRIILANTFSFTREIKFSLNSGKELIIENFPLDMPNEDFRVNNFLNVGFSAKLGFGILL